MRLLNINLDRDADTEEYPFFYNVLMSFPDLEPMEAVWKYLTRISGEYGVNRVHTLMRTCVCQLYFRTWEWCEVVYL